MAASQMLREIDPSQEKKVLQRATFGGGLCLITNPIAPYMSEFPEFLSPRAKVPEGARGPGFTVSDLSYLIAGRGAFETFESERDRREA